jgi:hypothetical protein
MFVRTDIREIERSAPSGRAGCRIRPAPSEQCGESDHTGPAEPVAEAGLERVSGTRDDHQALVGEIGCDQQ